jgi:hypothetical protein
MLTLIVFMIAIGFIENIEAKEVACEKIEDMTWVDPVGTAKTCFFETTIINERNTTISTKDSSVRGLVINNNNKAEYLFVRIAQSFPNLEAYSVYRTSVRELSKQNFAGLNKLKILVVANSQIEKIESKTFEDLVSLVKLWLCKKEKNLVLNFEF